MQRLGKRPLLNRNCPSNVGSGVDDRGKENYDTVNKSVFIVRWIHNRGQRVHGGDHKTFPCINL